MALRARLLTLRPGGFAKDYPVAHAITMVLMFVVGFWLGSHLGRRA